MPKRRQGIYTHPCGGLHFIQAVARWAKNREVRTRWQKRLDRQINVLLFRVGSEQQQYEAALQQAPGQELLIAEQVVKFQGHLLDTLGRMKTDLSFQPTPAQKQIIETSKAYLDQAVARLWERGAFQSMAQLKATQPAFSRDLITDACIAARGLSAWAPARR